MLLSLGLNVSQAIGVSVRLGLDFVWAVLRR